MHELVLPRNALFKKHLRTEVPSVIGKNLPELQCSWPRSGRLPLRTKAGVRVLVSTSSRSPSGSSALTTTSAKGVASSRHFRFSDRTRLESSISPDVTAAPFSDSYSVAVPLTFRSGTGTPTGLPSPH